MVGRVVVMEQTDYEAWLTGNLGGGSLAQRGERLFNERAFDAGRALYDGTLLGKPFRAVAKTFQVRVWRELQAAWLALRSDVRAQKVAILTEVMGFSEGEDKAFWPIYREYDGEMSKLGDERVALIAEYAKNYSTLTDAVADTLAARALDLEGRRRAALAKCYERVKAASSPRTALRFLQVEHQLQLLIDLQIASSLPVAPPAKEVKK